MITNALLSEISRRTGANALGEELFDVGEAVALACFLDDVSSSQRWTLGATIKDASRVCFLEKAALGTVAPPIVGDRLTAAVVG